MGLKRKICLAFVVLMLIAIALGTIGWRTSRNISQSLEEVIIAELPLNDSLNKLTADMERLTVVQRTLLNVNFEGEMRQRQHAYYLKSMEQIKTAGEEINALFGQYADQIEGMPQVRRHWQDIQKSSSEWMEANQAFLAMVEERENSTIINPTRLLGSLQRYRGDHFNLVSRLAKMVVQNKDFGPDINSSDTACAFGKWRVNFDQGKEPFSSNPVFVDAMAKMKEPHRLFHVYSHEVQQLLRQNPKRNGEKIVAAFLATISAAEQVIGHFDAMVAEAAKAETVYNHAVDYGLNTLGVQQDQLREQLSILTRENDANLRAILPKFLRAEATESLCSCISLSAPSLSALS